MVEIKSNYGLVAENEKGYLSIIDGITPNKNYREQVGKELSQVKRYIDNNTGLNTWIYPLLVFPFGSVMKELVLESEHDKLKLPVLNEKDLLKYIYSNNQYKLNSDQIKKISEVLEEWQKDQSQIKYEEGLTKYGKKYVRVKGSLEESRRVCKSYEEKGCKTSEVNQDKKEAEVYYFYVEK